MSKIPTGFLRVAACIAGLSWAAASSRAAEPLATVPAIVASHVAVYAGKPAPGQVLHLVVSLPLRNPAGLDALLADIYEPASPNYGNYLSATEFTERFGATAADYSTVVNFFTAQGLTVTQQTESRYLIDVDATVADVERVFHVQMGLYQDPTENRLFFSPDRAPTVDIPVPLQEIIGLDNFVLPHPKSLYHSDSPVSRGGSGPGGQFDGHDIRKAYYPSGTLDGAGQSVGLMELDGLNLSDVQLFFTKNYGSADNVSVVFIKTDSLSTSCGAGCDDSEQALDVEYTVSVAPGLSSVRVYFGSSPRTC